jgi:multimeric flavodoxin WrbA
MEQIYDALEYSDAIVLGSPVYFDTVSAQSKLIIDRSNCLMPCVKKADGTFGSERDKESEEESICRCVPERTSTLFNPDCRERVFHLDEHQACGNCDMSP